MKVTAVEIHPAGSSEMILLSFRDPGSTNPYNIIGITGLDADAIVPKYYRGPSSSFYNMSLVNRDVVMQIGLNPDFTAYKTFSDLRDDLYRLIASSRTGKVSLHFKNRLDTVAVLSGSISKFETPLFEKKQTVTLTMACDDPMLRAPDPVVLFQDIAISPEDNITVIVRHEP